MVLSAPQASLNCLPIIINGAAASAINPNVPAVIVVAIPSPLTATVNPPTPPAAVPEAVATPPKAAASAAVNPVVVAVATPSAICPAVRKLIAVVTPVPNADSPANVGPSTAKNPEIAAPVVAIAAPPPTRKAMIDFNSCGNAWKAATTALAPLSTGLKTFTISRPKTAKASVVWFWNALIGSIAFSKLVAVTPALLALALIFASNFSILLMEGAIAARASVDPNNLSNVSAPSLPVVFNCFKIPLNPKVFSPAALKLIPKSFANSTASELGFRIAPIAVLKPAKVDSTGTPEAVAVAIAPLSSSRLTPAALAVGAILAICEAY